MQQQRASIDPDDPITCSQWAVSLGTSVAELKAAVRQFGAAADAVAHGIGQWRDPRARGRWKDRLGAGVVGILSHKVMARGELLCSLADARVFALGTMFHPKYWAASDRASAQIVTAFAEAVRNRAASGTPHGGS